MRDISIDLQQEIDKFISKCKAVFDSSAVDNICKAVEYSSLKHSGQFRYSGEPYFVHPLAVASILVDMGIDVPSVIAGLLHDVLEDCEVSDKQLESVFGAEITMLVNGVTKLASIKHKRTDIKDKGAVYDSSVIDDVDSSIAREFVGSKLSAKELEQAENIRKMMVAVAKDIRILLIKLADRLHNMRTISGLPTVSRQRAMAKETLEIFAPFATRLGLSYIKSELEDLCFKTLESDEYERLVISINLTKGDRENRIDYICKQIYDILSEHDIIADISGRHKHLYSIYKKIVAQGKSIDEIYDLIAIRVIVASVTDCYTVLGAIHHKYHPIPKRIKDYISIPKDNKYQSLHTTVMTPLGVPFEIQIRTKQMHEIAEYGIAAHWKYKERQSDKSYLEDRLAWLRNVMESSVNSSSPAEFLELLKADLYTDQLFVFSPKGDVVELVGGSCPIDFAYSVHSEIGNKCVGAKVNGVMVPLITRLSSGDRVEILTSQSSKGPSRDWLRHVKTTGAQSKIKAFFKKSGRDENIKRGKEICEMDCKRKGYKWADIAVSRYYEPVLARLSIASMDDMYAVVGYGGLSSRQIVSRIIESYDKDKLDKDKTPKLVQARKPKIKDSGILIRGQRGLLVGIAKCCTPVFGDDIVGFISRGKGVKVHRASCINLKTDESYRLIEAEWDTENAGGFVTKILVKCDSSDDIVLRLGTVLNELKVGISSISIVKTPVFQVLISINVKDTDIIKKILRKLESLKYVHGVHRE